MFAARGKMKSDNCVFIDLSKHEGMGGVFMVGQTTVATLE
jgi:hypothetical protein